jgi:hypothetical protein
VNEKQLAGFAAGPSLPGSAAFFHPNRESILMKNSLRNLSWAFVASAVGFCGCADSGVKVPPLGQVHGTVTLDGKPLPNANILFQPVDGKSGPSQGITDSEGKYTLNHVPGHPGATITEHTVRITGKTADAIAADKEVVPPKYNEQTTLKVTVREGDNTHDFKLESK